MASLRRIHLGWGMGLTEDKRVLCAGTRASPATCAACSPCMEPGAEAATSTLREVQ